MEKKLVLIDGHSILNRAFYGVPDLTNAQGIHTNAVYGFLNILFKILDEEKPEYLTVAFDLHAPTFRHKMFEGYKGTRKPMAEELRQQVPLIKEMLIAMDVKIVEKEGFEADDLIGTLAKRGEQEGLVVSVVSGDRDLLQLASTKIKIRIPKTKKTGMEIEDYLEDDVKERYMVTPTEFIDVKALMGDASDNIPGVPGIGEKTAMAIISMYKSIEEAYAHVEEIKPNRAKENLKEYFEQAKLSKVLATIEINVPLDYSFEEALLSNLYTKDAYLMCKRLEFKNLLSRFQNIDTNEEKEEKNFYKVTDFSKAEALFTGYSKEKELGFFLFIQEHEVVAISISSKKEGTALFVPEGFLTQAYLLDKLNDLFTKGVKGITFGLKSQLKFLTSKQPADFFDTEIAAYLLNPLKNDYSYEDIAKDYINRMIPSRADLLGKTSLSQAMEEKPEEFLQYACYCADACLYAKDVMQEQLKEQEMEELFETIEMPLAFTLFDMEQEGIAIDAKALKVYGDELKVSIEKLEKEIYEQAEEEFNINSPKQLGVVLFEKMQMPNGKKTKTGYSTAADVLEKLAVEYPFVSKILEYRQLTKLKSTYADGLANYIEKDGRIHTTFNQTIAATGRISSTEPNLQNIPIRMELGRLIRKVFLPKEGYIFLDADYSQIELRVLADMSGDEKLIEAYRQAQDIHRITASQVFHVPFEEVTSLQRRNAKAVNFGIVYGISSFGLSQGLSISRKEAASYIERYFETYPGIKMFLDGLVAFAKEHEYVSTMFHRKRPVPELKSSNFMQRSFGERVAMNSPIQGTAADIIKIAMIRVNQRLKDEKLKSRLILQVHDELLVETAKEELEQVQTILSEEMQHAADLKVNLEIDMHTGNNWYEAK